MKTRHLVILYICIITLVLALIGGVNRFYPEPWFSYAGYILAIPPALFVSIEVFKYQTGGSLTKQSIKSPRDLLNILFTFILAPALFWLFSVTALTSGIGTIITDIAGTELEPQRFIMQIRRPVSTRAFCKKYLVNRKISQGFSRITFCIDSKKYRNLNHYAEVEIVFKKTILGYKVKKYKINENNSR